MFKQLQQIFFTTMLMLTFIEFTVQTDLYEGSICQLHTGETGTCKNANKCEWLIKNLKKHKMGYSDIRRCFFTGTSEEVVCCGDEHPIKPIVENPGPCELGFLFDSFNCVSPSDTLPLEPTPSTVPDVPNQNKISGSKIAAACEKYSKHATVYFPSSIINGSPAGLSEFPHMVALGYDNNENGYDFDCGGSLIAENWVVTAAHCIKDRRKPVIVRMGKVSLYTDDDGADPVDRTIVRHIRHPKYSVSTKKNDIALIEFDGVIEFNDLVRPACIRTTTADPPQSQEMLIAGWGSIEADRTNRSEILLKANVTSVPLEQCNRTLLEYNQLSNLPSLRALTDTQMCAVNLIERSDACQGDSGGPVFLNDFRSGVSTIVGIVSFGISCGTELPGVYTRIASYMDWIESIVWK